MPHLRRLVLTLPFLLLGACGDAPAVQAPGASAPAAKPPAGADTAASAAALPSRRYRFTYEARVPKAPSGTKVLRLWAPLPRDEEGVQRISDLRIEAPDGARETVSADFGNRFLFAEVSNPGDEVTLRWSATVVRTLDQGQGKGEVNERYLAPDRLVPLGDEAREAVVRLRLEEDGLEEREIAQRIYDDVLAGMVYDKSEPGWGEGDFLRSLTVCKGNCTDFHARFIGVGRAAGLPVRFSMGIPMDPSKTSYNSYHCWAHWFDTASGTWRPVDISEADKIADRDPAGAARFFGQIDPHRITLTYGRDLNLEPRQAGPPLNFMVFPYAEADGVQVPMDKSMWTFSWVDL